MKQKIKKVALFIVVIVVIVFMAAGYLFSGLDLSSQPAPEASQPDLEAPTFTGPTGEPSVIGPTEPPPGTSPAAQ